MNLSQDACKFVYHILTLLEGVRFEVHTTFFAFIIHLQAKISIKFGLKISFEEETG